MFLSVKVKSFGVYALHNFFKMLHHLQVVHLTPSLSGGEGDALI
jgi:hypothetical protein